VVALSAVGSLSASQPARTPEDVQGRLQGRAGQTQQGDRLLDLHLYVSVAQVRARAAWKAYWPASRVVTVSNVLALAPPAAAGNVYNVTDFLGDHPGGKKAILLYAGKDATEEFLMLHKPDIIVKVRAVASQAQLALCILG
jgi:hypothetical protein